MYPFGHIGITLFLATLFLIPGLFAVAGVLLPDIVDKVFLQLGFLPCGRSLGHNLFFGPIIAGITYLITRKKIFAFAVLFGAYLHLLQDATNFIPWFYPLVEYEFDCPTKIQFTPGLFEIIGEVVGISLVVVLILFKSKVIYLREKIFNWIGVKHSRASKKLRGKKRKNKK